jgi:hypothetical protein
VNSATQLEQLGDETNDGETVRVARPATPYRTTEWIDINASNFILTFQSRWAENGEPVVKPADGANVGGV